MYLLGNVNNKEEIKYRRFNINQIRLNILYEFWIEADNFFNIFSLSGRERDKYTERGTAGQIVPPTVGRLECILRSR